VVFCEQRQLSITDKTNNIFIINIQSRRQGGLRLYKFEPSWSLRDVQSLFSRKRRAGRSGDRCSELNVEQLGPARFRVDVATIEMYVTLCMVFGFVQTGANEAKSLCVCERQRGQKKLRKRKTEWV